MGAKCLTERYSVEQLQAMLADKESLSLYPRWENRSAWQQIPDEAKHIAINEAEQFLGFDWPALPATLFMEYSRNGNRTRYEQPYFVRRKALAALAAAECLEGKGRFIDDLINGIWAICEETTWVIPAHSRTGAAKYGKQQPLADIDEPIIDLFAAETGALLAFVYALLEQPLNDIAPIVPARMEREVEQRILQPFLTGNFGWMGLDLPPGHPINNWNPWCTSNCLTAVLFMENNHSRRLEAVYKGMRILDVFLAGYEEDGGCDEGPSYWERAGASLFDCLELLRSATAGGVNVYNIPLIQEIGKYITRAHIAGRYFVNYADGSAIVNISSQRVYLYGKQVGDEAMMSLGLKAFHESPARSITGTYSLFHRLMGLFTFAEMKQQPVREVILREVWMKNLQVFSAREHADRYGGFYISAKGGHNQESHNHNDVGNFIVYYDGQPFFIDAGVEAYTAKTFGPERYTIWTMQSDYHNLPTIRGWGQQAGAAYRSSNVSYHAEEEKVELEMDLAEAYPPEAGVVSWKRNCSLHRGAKTKVEGTKVEGKVGAYVEIAEKVHLAKPTDDIKLNFMTAMKPERLESEIILKGNSGASVRMTFDSSLFVAQSESIETNDSRLKPVWGTEIYRTVLKLLRPVHMEEWKLRIERIN